MINLVRLNHYPIYKQLQLEEALLRADARNWCLVNDGSPDAIVMGISGQPSQWIDSTIFEKRPVPLIRRFSGGGTVFVDTNTMFVTWICQADELAVPCCPEKVMRWSERLYQPLFKGFRAHENDYILGDKKFGGNAQYLCKNRWLHHSSLLWDYDPANMELLAMPPRMPKYRETRAHKDFLCSLKQHWPKKEQLCDEIVALVKSQFDVLEVSVEEALKVADRPHRKATTLL